MVRNMCKKMEKKEKKKKKEINLHVTKHKMLALCTNEDAKNEE